MVLLARKSLKNCASFFSNFIAWVVDGIQFKWLNPTLIVFIVLFVLTYLALFHELLKDVGSLKDKISEQVRVVTDTRFDQNKWRILIDILTL